jgi:hypothetical protein
MPDAVTHCFVARDVKDSLSYPYLSKHFNLMQIGAQGPDPLFYHHYQPWKKNLHANKLGSRLHTEKTKPYLEAIIKAASSDEDKAWVSGFLTHFALDTSAHPYIFYRTGLYDRKNQENRGYHLMLERTIDHINIKEAGFNPSTYNIRDRHFSTKTIPSSITAMLNEVGEKLYNEKELGLRYTEGYHDFRSAIGVLAYDPRGLKKAIYLLLDRITRSEILYSALSPYNCESRGLDHKNKAKKTWHHPVTNEPSNESFDEMVERAKDKSKRLIQAANTYWTTGNKEVFDLIQDESYDTGMATGKHQMVHFDIMY